MSGPAAHPLPVLIFSGSHVVQTLAGISTDITRISGNFYFDGFPSIRSRPRFVQYAIKVLRVSPTDHNQIDRIVNMLAVFSEHLWERNAAFTHPNIAPVTVANVTTTTENQPINYKAILTPWYSGGSILEHVNTHRSGVDRITLLIELGKALNHLHSHDVVHGAVHPSNILIDNSGHVVVTDAGIRTLVSQYLFIPFNRLPVPQSGMYQPSEQLYPATDTMVQPTTAMDVYSFAVTAWTIFSGKKPFANLPNLHTIAQIVVEIGLHGHQRLVKPDNLGIDLWVLLQKCLAVDPAHRPTMAEVVAELESLSL